jgi:AraC family transcriptional regulator
MHCEVSGVQIQLAYSVPGEVDVEHTIDQDGTEGDRLACALAMHLVRTYSSLSEHITRKTSRALSEQVLRQVTDYIGDNLASRLKLSDIAGIANLSRFHVSRFFKASTGLSPHQCVIERRSEPARELLTATDLPIHEIAWQVGFADQRHPGRHNDDASALRPGRFRWLPTPNPHGAHQPG